MLLISCEDLNKESIIAYVKLIVFKFGQWDSIFDGSKNIDSSTGAIVGICLLLKSRFLSSNFTIFPPHQFVRIWIPSLLHIFVAFETQKIYATCSRRGYALLYRWFSGPWRPGPSPSRRIYQRAVAHKQ